MGEKGAIVSKQQVSDEFLDGFRAVWQIVFCLTEHDAEEDGEQCEGQNASLLDAVGDWEAARQRPIVLYLTLLTFMELSESGEKFGGTAKARQDFPQSITADSIKALVRSTKAACRPIFCTLHFSCNCLSTNIMSVIPLLDLNPHWHSGVFSCAIV